MLHCKKIGILIISLFFLFNFNVLASITTPSQKIYPPYPDVWGYDVSSFPAFKAGGGSVRTFRMKDGDIWFIVSYDYQYKNSMKENSGFSFSKRVLIKFFKQEIIHLNEKEFDQTYTQISNNSLKGLVTDSDSEIKFKDGSSIKHISESVAKRCRTPNFINNYIIKKDSNGNEKKFSILAAFPTIRWNTDEGNCEFSAAPFIYQKLYFLGDYFLDLGDDTFIVYSMNSNLILRFDKNLETKFKPKNPLTYSNGIYIDRNFFVIKYDLIEKYQEEISNKQSPYYQTIHDNLLVHLREKFMSKKQGD